MEGAAALPPGGPGGQGVAQGPYPSFVEGSRSMEQSQNSRMSGSRMDSSADSLKDSSVSSFEIIPAKPSGIRGECDHGCGVLRMFMLNVTLASSVCVHSLSDASLNK